VKFISILIAENIVMMMMMMMMMMMTYQTSDTEASA